VKATTDRPATSPRWFSAWRDTSRGGHGRAAGGSATRGGRSTGTRVWKRSCSRGWTTRRFGQETAGKLSELLDGLPDPDGIDRVTDALIECSTGEEFIERMRMP